MESNDPLVNGGRVKLINQDELQHTLGRIEEALLGLRRDLQELLLEQRNQHTRLDGLDERVGKLEGWQERRRTRARLIGGIAALLLLPALGWVQATVRQIDHILEHVKTHKP